MLAAVQVPEPQLSRMSTAGLVETVLQYPLYGDMNAYFWIQEGIDALRHDFNGLEALFNRRDAGMQLLQAYQAIDAAAVETKPTDLEQGVFVSKLVYIEAMLAQPEMLGQLSSKDRQYLISNVMEQKKIKDRLFAIYDVKGIESTAFLAGRILQTEQALGQTDEKVKCFLQDSSYANDADLQMISEVIFRTAADYIANLPDA